MFVPPETGALAWIDTFAARPWIVVIAVVVVIGLIYAAYWLMKNKMPPRDRPLTIDADAAGWGWHVEKDEGRRTKDEGRRTKEDWRAGTRCDLEFRPSYLFLRPLLRYRQSPLSTNAAQ